MAKLSNTDLKNLKTLENGGTEFHGQGRAMQELIRAGLVLRTTRPTPKGNQVYWYKTTKKGAAALAA